MKMMFSRFSGGRLLPLLWLPLASAGAADLVGHWKFDDPADLGKATLGSALTLTGTVTSTTGPGTDGAADVAKGGWFSALNPIPANGSSGTPTRTNQYSIVLDFQVPDFTDAAADSGTFTGLFDFDNGGSDGDFFIRKQTNQTELGVSGQWPYIGAGPTANGNGASGTVRSATWYRLVLAVDNGVGRSLYLNGALIGNYGTGTLDAARQSLATATPWRILWDNDGETSRVVVANLALYNGQLTAQEAGILGSAGASLVLPNLETLSWSGAAGSEWSTNVIAGSKNWVLESDGTTPKDFETFDTVHFKDTAATPTVTIANGDVEPTSVSIDNSVLDYTFTGANGIKGNGGITKTGDKKLTLSNPNVFTGPTQIQGGQLVIGNEFALQNSVLSATFGTGATHAFGNVTTARLGGLAGDADLALENASLQPVSMIVGSAANASFGGLLSGAGSLTKTGTGRQTIFYDNTYTGGTTVQGGILLAGLSTSFGTGNVILDGGSVEFEIAQGTESIVANNFILPGGTGNLSLFGSFGPNRVAPTPGTATRLTGKISGGSADRVFRISDTNVTGEHDNITILDNAANDFLGTIELWRATVAFTSDAALGNAANDIRISTENLLGSLRFDADNITLNAGRSIQFYTNTAAMPVNTQDFTGTIAGDFSGVGNFVKQGTGTLILTGTNNATGITTVAAGTLRVNGSFATGGGTVTVSADGTLAGTGTISRTVAVAGRISPGASVGTLTTGTTSVTGVLDVEVDGASADQLVVAGDLDLTGATLEVNLLPGGFTQSSYVIATYSGTLTGAFTAITPGFIATYGGGQVVLKQGTAAGFDLWAASKGVSGFNADSDGDGIANGIEFVIGGEPAPGAGSNSNALLPVATYHDATDELVFVFRRTPDAAYLNPVVQYSTSLSGTWNSAPAGTVIGTAAGADLVEVRLPASLAAGGRIFTRLTVAE